MDRIPIESALMLAIAVLCLIQISSLGALKRQLADQSRRLDKALRLLGGGDPLNMLSKEALDRVQQLIREGQKIQAIRDVREETGMSLKEAKDYVDSL